MSTWSVGNLSTCWSVRRKCKLSIFLSRRLAMSEIDYLKQELDDLRYREQRRVDDEIRARKERDREREAVYEEGLRMAKDWPEALQNQMNLIGTAGGLEREAVDEGGRGRTNDGREALQNQIILRGREASLDEDEYGSEASLDNWFVDGKRACGGGLELWKIVEGSK